ncbi:hypothetical protein AB205_0181050 [Aquarana catesbeiana]|uniref:Uncharacterized protein n=1 Tax=Aquarana catesbeiana TaxID=8400 RepID=A0A2G9NB54_AQUCT|nr:hypothetical protein AB205_0181050 [Aquarana catesbeiana]
MYEAYSEVNIHETNAAGVDVFYFKAVPDSGDPESCLLVCISTTGSPPSPGRTAPKRPQSQSRTTCGHE